MQHVLTLTTILFLTACSNNTTDKTATVDTQIPTELTLGERIDGPANIRDTVNGKILFTLNDNVLVETSPTQNQWLVVGLFVKLTSKQYDDLRLLPGSDLISTDGVIIGKTTDTVNAWMGQDSLGLIGAYTHIDNIKPMTIPENVLTELLNQGKSKLSDFDHFFENFKFRKDDYSELPNLTQYYVYESVVEDLSPRDRITLLFSKDNNLVGVVHSRQLEQLKFKTYELIRGHRLTITADLKQDDIQKLIDKRIEFYNSVD